MAVKNNCAAQRRRQASRRGRKATRMPRLAALRVGAWSCIMQRAVHPHGGTASTAPRGWHGIGAVASISTRSSRYHAFSCAQELPATLARSEGWKCSTSGFRPMHGAYCVASRCGVCSPMAAANSSPLHTSSIH